MRLACAGRPTDGPSLKHCELRVASCIATACTAVPYIHGNDSLVRYCWNSMLMYRMYCTYIVHEYVINESYVRSVELCTVRGAARPAARLSRYRRNFRNFLRPRISTIVLHWAFAGARATQYYELVQRATYESMTPSRPQRTVVLVGAIVHALLCSLPCCMSATISSLVYPCASSCFSSADI